MSKEATAVQKEITKKLSEEHKVRLLLPQRKILLTQYQLLSVQKQLDQLQRQLEQETSAFNTTINDVAKELEVDVKLVSLNLDTLELVPKA